MDSVCSVLFVCLGNICRSPLGEGIFSSLLEQQDLQQYYRVDSCGTGGWHVGAKPHRDSIRVAHSYGIDISGQRARQFQRSDFESFNLIVAMDRENRRTVQAMSGSTATRIVCLREFDSDKGDHDVPDPYYGGPEGFQEVYEIIHRCCDRLLVMLETERGAGS